MPDRKEYIERRALLENLERFAPEHLTQLLRDLISKQPAADVVEVVRCSQCKHYDGKACELLCEDADQYSTGHSTYMDDNDYCSYGERKDGADND